MRKPPRSINQRRLDFTLFALAILTMAAVITALYFDSPLKENVSAQTYAAPTADSSKDTRPTALFVGDSYTYGTGAENKQDRWTSIVANEMGWRELNAGQGGTGYVTTAGVEACGKNFCGAYPEAIRATNGVDPDIIIIAGGQNDFSAFDKDAEMVEEGVDKTFEQIRKVHDEVQIIAVGPSTAANVDDIAIGLDAAVRRAADEAGARYVSLLEPDVIEDDMILEDGGHVGNSGHAAIAKRVLETLR